MRKLTLLLAFSFSAVFAAAPKVVVVSQYLDGRDRVVQVRNDSETAATAFLVGASESSVISTDMLLGARGGRLLKPGETAEVKVPKSSGADAQVMAAIFEDGTIEGDIVAANRLFTTRRNVYSQIPLALSLLNNQNIKDFPASTVAGWFRQWRERWQSGDPTRDVPVAVAAEMYLTRAGNGTAAGAAHELIEVFEELSAKLAASKPEL